MSLESQYNGDPYLFLTQRTQCCHRQILSQGIGREALAEGTSGEIDVALGLAVVGQEVENWGINTSL
jgi:hypothetical protein